MSASATRCIGWAVGAGGSPWDGFVASDSDGGYRWTKQDVGTSITQIAIAFADADHGWIELLGQGSPAVPAACHRRRWRPWTRNYPLSSGALYSVACADAEHVLAGGDGAGGPGGVDGVMLASADGGAACGAPTWESSSEGVRGLAFSHCFLAAGRCGYGGIFATRPAAFPR